MMQKQIRAALISVFYKDGLEPLVRLLSENGVAIYSTGGTQQYIEQLGLECIPVESVTDYPSILGVKGQDIASQNFWWNPGKAGGRTGSGGDERVCHSTNRPGDC